MKKDTTAYGAERPAWDRSDCSVRALAVATGVPYAVASVVFSSLGRRIGRGTEEEMCIRLYEEILGCRRIEMAEGMRLEPFVTMAQKGRFVIHKHRHAFAVVDGVVHDWEGTSREGTVIVRAWRIGDKALVKMNQLAGLV